MPPTATATEPQTVTRESDIPDANFKKPKPVVLPTPVRLEREARRFIRKDGIFIKDYQRLFDRPTGKRDHGGNMIRERSMTDEEATALVIKEVKASGRKVVTDAVTGRLKAVPGWDLELHVPGMQKEEQHAAAPLATEDQAKINTALLAKLTEENAALKKDMAALLERFEGSGGPTVNMKMTNDELDEYAEEHDIDLAGCTNKAAKVKTILAAE